MVAIVGALLYALGFFTSAFAPSGLILCVTYGFLAGTSYSKPITIGVRVNLSMMFPSFS